LSRRTVAPGATFLVLVALAGPSVGARQPSAPPGWKGTCSLESGVPVVRNPETPLLGPIALELEEDLVIGSPADPNTFFFYRISAGVDPGGSICIWDPNSFRIQVFDRTGRYLRTVGRRGEGPGEFSDAWSLRFRIGRDDRLYVRDGPRIHVFDRAGRFHELIPIESAGGSFTVGSDGTILYLDPRFGPEGMAESVVATSGERHAGRVIASFPSLKWEAVYRRRARYTFLFPELVLEPAPGGSAVFGYPSEYRIQRVDGTGRVVARIEREERPARITAVERRRLLDEVCAANPSEDRAELERRTLFPDHRPYFDDLLCDESGFLFVRRVRPSTAERPGTEFDLFTPDGFFLRSVTVSLEECLAIRDGFLYARRYDGSLGCAQLVRLRIRNWNELRGGSVGTD
jgi:hypothetical protein